MEGNIKNKEGNINILDLFFYLLSYWYWFVAAIVLCMGIALIRYSRAEAVYGAAAQVIIKDPSNTRSTTGLDAYSGRINRVNLSNEIYQFRSKRLMREAVRRIEANVDYKERVRVHNVELYCNSPLKVIFPADMPDIPMEMSLTAGKDSTVTLECGKITRTVHFRDTVAVNGINLVIIPGASYGPESLGKEIRVLRHTVVGSAASYLSRFSVGKINEDVSILGIDISDANAQRACDLLSALIDVYNEDAVSDKNQVALNTADFINSRIAIISQELGDVESQIQAFKSENHVMSVNEAATQYLADGRNANQAIIAIETSTRLVQYLKDYIMSPANADAIIPGNTGINDERIEALISQYNSTKMQRDRLLLESSEESPVIKSLNVSLSSIKSNIVSAIDNKLMSLEVRRSDIERQEQEALSKFSHMPQTARQMISIERQQGIKENLYVYLLNKREENAIARSMVENNARIVDAAECYGQLAPNRNKMLLLGFLIGFLIPMLVLLVRMMFDSKVRSRKEIEDNVTAPFLGEIPLFERTSWQKRLDPDKLLYYDGNGRSVFTESFRMLCTNIDMLRPEGLKGGLVLTSSSFLVNSGKSFTTVNAAACFADNRKKVIMLDLDMRKRTLSRHFNVAHKTKGVSNFLFNPSIKIEDIVIKDIVKGVDIIPAGMVPPNPVELLKRERFDNLVAQLRKSYDYIIIDNVPVDIVADPMLINRVVDVTVFVVRSGKLDRRLLPMLDSIYKEGRLNNLGVVFNGSPMNHHYGYNYGYGYGYGYSYGSGYGYSYGYGYGEKD